MPRIGAVGNGDARSMITFFLHRPVFASVCAFFIVLAGLVSIPTLPIAQFPQVAPPVVTVAARIPEQTPKRRSRP